MSSYVRTTNRPEVKFDWTFERRSQLLRDLFVIIRQTDILENAYYHNAINDEEYTKECRLLIEKFKSTRNCLRDSGEENSSFADIRVFTKKYWLECQRAVQRLESGVPATELSAASTNQTLLVQRATEKYISLSDLLEMVGENPYTTSELCVYVQELCLALNRLSFDYEGKNKIGSWLMRLNGMHASDTLNERDQAQLKLDVLQSYTAFRETLEMR